MRIIKRNGSEEDFNIEKIINAVKKANGSGEHKFLTDEQIEDVADYVEYKCNKIRRAVSVEEIQDMVEDQLMAKGAFELARRYVRYRYRASSAPTTRRTTRSSPSSSATTRKSSRRTPTRTLPSTAFSVTIWPVRSAVTLQEECFCRLILLRLIRKVLFTSTIRTILHSICTTATL